METMDGPRHPGRLLRSLLLLVCLALPALAAPAVASAEAETHTFRVPIAVEGYEVKQDIAVAPHPEVDGFITAMRTDIVDEDGRRVPIQRLMLHHIVFANLARPDSTCQDVLGWDSETRFPAPERFFAAGEERARMVLPPGYGYRTAADDPWGLLYMVMNHRRAPDRAFIEYEVTVESDPSLQPVEPYWLDVRNCRADPIYNVPGTEESGSTHVLSRDFEIAEDGRIVAGGGHVHGGARELSLTQPACGNRELARSTPTWGKAEHPFYNVRPILHEPGPINMSAFTSESGIPVTAGQPLRLNSAYENSRPHTRVMGIMLVYVAPDPSVDDPCAPLPSDIQTHRTTKPGRAGPIPFRVPLTGLDRRGRAVDISAPPGPLRRLSSGDVVTVGDRYFSPRNAVVDEGTRLRWRFFGSELHNLTLANGPVGIASPNLNDGRGFSHRFGEPGTYRFFCAIHPVDMSERLIVRPSR
jgi:hypothetical protein